MRTYLEIAWTGLTSLLLHPQRSLVTTACVVAVLLPYLAGLGVSRGVQDDAEAAIRFGADLYVSGEQFGRPAPVPIAAAQQLRKIPGVVSVVPRIVGRIELGKDRVSAVLVGIPLDDFPAGMECIRGRLYTGGSRNELVVGSELAKRLRLDVGTNLLPFYHSRTGDHTSEIVGIFHSDVSLWQARLIVTSLRTAGHIFDQPDLATDLLVTCRSGYEDEVRRAILHSDTLQLPGGGGRLRVVSRDDLSLLLSEGPRQREGIFTLFFVMAFAVAILVVLVTSGFGLSERRREIAILKATGWQTDELLLRSLVESFLISLTGGSLAILLAFGWLRGLNGYVIASVFLNDVDRSPAFRVPFRLVPIPVLLALLIAFIVVLSGSLYSTWRAAITPPREAMR
jgi:ABC-type lipoprotein release transport system permease subunit